MQIVSRTPTVGIPARARTSSYRCLNDSGAQLYQAIEVAAIQEQRVNKLLLTVPPS